MGEQVGILGRAGVVGLLQLLAVGGAQPHRHLVVARAPLGQDVDRLDQHLETLRRHGFGNARQLRIERRRPAGLGLVPDRGAVALRRIAELGRRRRECGALLALADAHGAGGGVEGGGRTADHGPGVGIRVGIRLGSGRALADGIDIAGGRAVELVGELLDEILDHLHVELAGQGADTARRRRSRGPSRRRGLIGLRGRSGLEKGDARRAEIEGLRGILGIGLGHRQGAGPEVEAALRLLLVLGRGRSLGLGIVLRQRGLEGGGTGLPMDVVVVLVRLLLDAVAAHDGAAQQQMQEEERAVGAERGQDGVGQVEVQAGDQPGPRGQGHQGR